MLSTIRYKALAVFNWVLTVLVCSYCVQPIIGLLCIPVLLLALFLWTHFGFLCRGPDSAMVPGSVSAMGSFMIFFGAVSLLGGGVSTAGTLSHSALQLTRAFPPGSAHTLSFAQSLQLEMLVLTIPGWLIGPFLFSYGAKLRGNLTDQAFKDLLILTISMYPAVALMFAFWMSRGMLVLTA